MGAPLFPIDAPLALVVEDDESNRDLFAQILTLAGIRVRAFGNASDALAALSSERPNVLVTDLMLPGMDGVQLATRVRAEPACEDLPILFVTGWPITPELRRRLPQKPTSVLMKPFMPDRLVARVTALLAAVAKKRARPLASRRRPLLGHKGGELLSARRILLIEDDAPFRYVMTKHLKHAGAEVVEVASLSQAQELLRRPGSLDAIVADIVLPDGDSPDALRALEQERRVPVLYITSFPPDRFRSYGFAASDPQLLAKPFDQATLVKRLCALCA